MTESLAVLLLLLPSGDGTLRSLSALLLVAACAGLADSESSFFFFIILQTCGSMTFRETGKGNPELISRIVNTWSVLTRRDLTGALRGFNTTD